MDTGSVNAKSLHNVQQRLAAKGFYPEGSYVGTSGSNINIFSSGYNTSGPSNLQKGISFGLGALSIAAEFWAMNKLEANAAATENGKVNHAILGAYLKTEQNVVTQEQILKGEQAKLEGFEKELAMTDANYIKNEEAELTKLTTAANETANKQKIDTYNAAKKDVDGLKSGKITIDADEKAIATAKGEFETFKSAQHQMTGGETYYSVTSDGTAESQVNSNKSKYNKTVNGKTEFNQSGFDADLQSAKGLDAQFKAKEQAVKDANLRKQQHMQGLQQYMGGKSFDNISEAYSDAMTRLTNAGAETMANGQSVASFIEAKAEYKSNIDKANNIRAKSEIEADIKAQKAKVEAQQAKLDAAVNARDEAKKQASAVGEYYTDVGSTKSKYDSKKADWKKQNDTNSATGKKRSWWNKLWGTNLSDAQKTQLQERKKAKRAYNNAKTAWNTSGLSEQDIEYMKKLGLMQ